MVVRADTHAEDTKPTPARECVEKLKTNNSVIVILKNIIQIQIIFSGVRSEGVESSYFYANHVSTSLYLKKKWVFDTNKFLFKIY